MTALRSGAHGGLVDVERYAYPVGHPLGDLAPVQQVVELDTFRPDDQAADLTLGPQEGRGVRLRAAVLHVAVRGAGRILPGAVGPDHLQSAPRHACPPIRPRWSPATTRRHPDRR